MDNLDFHNPLVPNLDLPIPLDDDEPIYIDDLDKPLPVNSAAPNNAVPKKANVSHTPLNLGGPPAPAAPRAAAPRAAAPVAAPVARVQLPKGTVKKSTVQVTSSERITGVKTFFTKLHPGAVEFLDEQICNWLAANPGVVVKRTNVTTGDMQSKKTEPNILVSVWY